MISGNTQASTLKAVSALYAGHHSWLLNQLTHRLNNQADAEDLCQQIFLRLCEHPEQLTYIRNPRAWLTTVAGRMCIDHWRKGENARKMVDAIAHQPEPEAPLPEQQVSDRQTLEAVSGQLEKLPGKTTAIFIDTRIHALTGKQVAQRHNVSLRTVRNHLQSTSRLLVTVCQAGDYPAAANFR